MFWQMVEGDKSIEIRDGLDLGLSSGSGATQIQADGGANIVNIQQQQHLGQLLQLFLCHSWKV